jgi:hypothetical protein
MNKNILCTLLLSLVFFAAFSQSKSPFTSIKPQLSEVINDFPYNYQKLKSKMQLKQKSHRIPIKNT